MHNEIKTHWKESYTLSANANFRKFLYNLKHGGIKALDFIDKNHDMMAMICEDVEALCSHIRQDDETVENKTYFYNLAMRQLPEVKTVLQNKFDSTMVFIHAWHPDVVLDGLTAMNILPELTRRQAEEASEPKEEKDEEPVVAKEPEIVETLDKEARDEEPEAILEPVQKASAPKEEKTKRKPRTQKA